MSALVLYVIAALATPLQTKAVDPCLGGLSTQEDQACQNEKRAAANRQLARYTAAARRVAIEIDAIVGKDAVTFGAVKAFDQATQAWGRYRDAECSAVVRKYATGTYAGIAATICETRLTEIRAYTVWEEWALSIDGSTKLPPPPLPTPARYHLYAAEPASTSKPTIPPR